MNEYVMEYPYIFATPADEQLFVFVIDCIAAGLSVFVMVAAIVFFLSLAFDAFACSRKNWLVAELLKKCLQKGD